MIPALIVPFMADPDDLLWRMIDTIDYPVDQLIIIDNSTTGLDRGRIRNSNIQGGYWKIDLPANLGVAGSWNLGIKSAFRASWWLIANFDIVWPAGSLKQLAAAADPSALVLSGGTPPWCAFALGEQVVHQIGLFDEALHPAYFEDNDYERRCQAAGVPVIQSGVPVHHDNSSTLAAGYAVRNSQTFGANAEYYGRKVERGDLSEGRWSLHRRRSQSWD